MKRLAGVLGGMVCAGLLAAATPAPGPGAKTYKTDVDGFIQNWLVLEPIRLASAQQNTDAAGRAIIDKEYFKDQLTVLPKDGQIASVEGGGLVWHVVNAKTYVVDLTGYAAERGKPVVSVLFWGVAYVTSPEEMKEVRLAIGSDDSSVWWVNGKEVIHAFGVRQTATDDNVSKRLTLNKGVNVVRFAVIQGDGPSDCCARFLDAQQKPMTGITVSLEPPK